MSGGYGKELLEHPRQQIECCLIKTFQFPLPSFSKQSLSAEEEKEEKVTEAPNKQIVQNGKAQNGVSFKADVTSKFFSLISISYFYSR